MDYENDETGSKAPSQSLAALMAGLMMARNNAQYAPQLPGRWKPKRRSLADVLGEGAHQQRFMLHYPFGVYGFSPDASQVHGNGDQIVRPMPGMVPVFKMPDVYHGPVAPQGIEQQGGPSRQWLAGPKHFAL